MILSSVPMLKLSELSDDIEVSYDEGPVYTVAELKADLLDGTGDREELLAKDWYTVERRKWGSDAESMVENYIENEHQDMYESWYENAMECFTPEIIAELQATLDKAFKDKSVVNYWTLDQRVFEIDVPMN